jgi:hypothetical protein
MPATAKLRGPIVHGKILGTTKSPRAAEGRRHIELHGVVRSYKSYQGCEKKHATQWLQRITGCINHHAQQPCRRREVRFALHRNDDRHIPWYMCFSLHYKTWPGLVHIYMCFTGCAGQKWQCILRINFMIITESDLTLNVGALEAKRRRRRGVGAGGYTKRCQHMCDNTKTVLAVKIIIASLPYFPTTS